MFWAILLALVTCLLNAVSAVIQRRVAGQPAVEKLFRSEFMKKITLNRWWIFGFALQTMAFIAQAGALKMSSLVLVEPLLTIDLVFLLMILHFKYDVPAGRKEWMAVAMICGGLGSLYAVADPQTGQRPFEWLPWIFATGPMLFVIAIAIYAVRRTKSSHKRAGISGIAAGISFAMVAVFTKLVVRELPKGFLTIFTHWPVYALLASGILGVVMTQNTYAAGPVAISQPVMEISEPIISVLMGIILFGDTINLSTGPVTLEIITALVTLSGIWLLSRSDRLHVGEL